MADSKQTVVAFVTKYSDSSVTDFVNGIAKHLPEYICKHVQLSNDVSESFHMQDSGEFDAVVLLHSVQEGRNAITDVPDAQYNNFLPELKRKYGAGRVAVVVYSMPSLQHSDNIDAMMLAFQRSQPTTFFCSECVIQCNNLQTMDMSNRHRLNLFLCEVLRYPLPVPREERSTEWSTCIESNILCDRYFSDLATDIGAEWQQLGYQLQLRKADIDHITEDNPTAVDRIVAMLQLWKNRSSCKNKRKMVEELCKALTNCNRKDLAEKIKEAAGIN